MPTDARRATPRPYTTPPPGQARAQRRPPLRFPHSACPLYKPCPCLSPTPPSRTAHLKPIPSTHAVPLEATPTPHPHRSTPPPPPPPAAPGRCATLLRVAPPPFPQASTSNPPSHSTPPLYTPDPNHPLPLEAPTCACITVSAPSCPGRPLTSPRPIAFPISVRPQRALSAALPRAAAPLRITPSPSPTPPLSTPPSRCARYLPHPGTNPSCRVLRLIPFITSNPDPSPT